MAKKTVRITVSRRVKVKPATVKLSKKKQDQVQWVSKRSFVIRFTGKSPFKKSRFSGRKVLSGRARPSVRPSNTRKYKYSVTVERKTLDPKVIVGP